MPVKPDSRSRIGRSSAYFLLAIIIIYLLLLIPESEPVLPEAGTNQAFLWQQDSLWFALEAQYSDVLQADCEQLIDTMDVSFAAIDRLLDSIGQEPALPPGDEKFRTLENAFFQLAPMIGACRHRMPEYIELFSCLRYVLKIQSRHWDMSSALARHTLYRLLYGGRFAIEEVMLQAPRDVIPALVAGHEEPSETPAAEILGIVIRSGDMLVSRGGAPTSALIARGNDYPGNFSHVALVHVDERTHEVSIIEAHIEIGVAVATIDEYLLDKKLRVMVLRLRADLPQLLSDPQLPHKAASLALADARARHVPYDFEMDFDDNEKLFCSEVASAPYRQLGVTLWMGISRISSPGVMRWLSAFGVRHFETQEPSDLEYDPQLRVVAEWRDPESLLKDHIDNAVIEVMLERAEAGKRLEYSWYMLPLARIVKLYSSILNLFGATGPMPEGMSATAGLRNERMSEDHKAIKTRVESAAREFRRQQGYSPPYWQLLNAARTAARELNF